MKALYSVVIAGVAGSQRRCPACHKLQLIDRVDPEGRYHCKHQGDRFTKGELRRPPRVSPRMDSLSV